MLPIIPNAFMYFVIIREIHSIGQNNVPMKEETVRLIDDVFFLLLTR